MKISRSELERIVNEELAHHIYKNFINEAPPSIGTSLDDEQQVDEENPDEIPDPSMAPKGASDELPMDDSIGGGGGTGSGDLFGGDGEAGEMVDGEDPVDSKLDDLAAGDELDEEPGSVADQIVGKLIKSVKFEDSESIPGAKEVVMKFDDENDAFRIIMQDDDFKFFYKGMHSDLGRADEIPVDEEGEEIEEKDNEEFEAEEEEAENIGSPLPTDDEMDTTPLPTED